MGTQFGWETSLDGIDWTGAFTSYVTITLTSDNFDIWYDEPNNKICLARTLGATSQYVYYNQGTANTDGTITGDFGSHVFSSATEITAYSDATWNRGYDVKLVKDSNGYPWIAWLRCKLSNWDEVVMKASATNGGAWNAPTSLWLNRKAGGEGCYILPLTSGKMFAISVSYGATVEVQSRLFNGASWVAAVSLGDLTESPTHCDMVADGDNVHFVFVKYSPTDIVYRKYIYGTGWQTAETVESSVVAGQSHPAITLKSTDKVRVSYLPSATTIKYRDRDAGSWQTAVTISSSESTITCVSSSYRASSGKLCVTWKSGAASPYNVKFVFLSLNSPPDAPTLSLPVANYHFNPSASVTFSWIFSDPDAGDYQTAYQFQLDNNNDFSSPITDTNKVSTAMSGWSYRKSHVIQAASGVGTNYQVKITVHYGSGTDSGKDVYLNNHSRTDFGDVRFTDNDGSTLLDYWMESKVDSNYAMFWVEVADDLSTVNVTVYVYYGKADATTTSNGRTTFLWFDDMEIDDTGWTNPASNPRTTEQMYQGSYSRKTASTTDTYVSPTLPDSFVVEANVEVTTTGDGTYPFSRFLTDTTARAQICWGYPASTAVGWWSSVEWENIFTYSTTPWYKTKVIYDLIGHPSTPYQVWIDDVLKKDWAVGGGGTTKPNRFIMRCDYTKIGYVDNVRFHKYVSLEPSHGAWGSEELPSASPQTTQVLPSTVGVYYWRVKTWDSKDAEGPYCAGKTVIVDRIRVTTCGILDGVVDTRTGGNVWYTAVYEYGSVEFTNSSGTLFLNGTVMTWENNCWTYAFPYQMSGSQAVFHITGVTESFYGLTDFNNFAGDIVLNWATMEITIRKP